MKKSVKIVAVTLSGQKTAVVKAEAEN